MPADLDARRFYRVALQRLEDGQALIAIERPRAAIYLTGYSVECIIKALLIVSTPLSERGLLLTTFRGAIAHNIDWLRDRLVRRTGRLPSQLNEHLTLVSSWSTDLRYEPGAGELIDAIGFLSAAKAIYTWADGRM